MSRFNYPNIKYNPLNLEEKYISPLCKKLEMLLSQKISELNIEINNFLRKEKTYEIYEISEELVVVFRKSSVFNISLNIGYPFSLCVADITNNTSFKHFKKLPVDVDIHLRGEVLRKKQRLMLNNFLGKSLEKVTWVSCSEPDKYRELASSLLSKLSKRKTWLYVDPYNFIGDSIVGLYFMDYLKKRFEVRNIEVLSSAYKHLGLFYKSHPNKKEIFDRLCKRSSVCIMPDLIDNHFGNTLALLNGLMEVNLYIFVVGRNLIVNINNNEARVFHYIKPDVFLRNKNIEDYMDDCLSPYVSINKNILREIPVGKKYKGHSNKFFISPHSTIGLKRIPVDFVLEITRLLIRKTKGKIYISEGNKKGDDLEWTKNFSHILKKEKDDLLLKSVIFLSDKNLGDLGVKLKKLRISSVLSADTSIAHLVNRLDIPQITYYNSEFWDKDSLQSLSAESPLGFCRYTPLQYPAVFNNDTEKPRFLEAVSKGLIQLSNNESFTTSPLVVEILTEFKRYMSKELLNINSSLGYKTHQNLNKKFLGLKKLCERTETSWLFYIFDPNKIVQGILSKPDKEKIAPLLYSAWRISPIYKFLNL